MLNVLRVRNKDIIIIIIIIRLQQYIYVCIHVIYPSIRLFSAVQSNQASISGSVAFSHN